MGVGVGEERCPVVDRVAEQILHPHPRRGKRRRTERQAANCADMVLELADTRPFDRPVAGIMDARSHLVEYRAVVAGEELEGEDTDIVERFGDARGEGDGGGGVADDRGRGGNLAGIEDAAVVLVAGDVIDNDRAVPAAGEDD